MTVPFDATLAIGVSLLGIISAIAHKSRCFLRHVNARWDWGFGFCDRPITPTSFDDSPNRAPDQSSPQCAPHLRMWVARLRDTMSGRG